MRDATVPLAHRMGEGSGVRILRHEISHIEPLNLVGTGSTPSQISFSQKWDDVEVVPTIPGVRFMGRAFGNALSVAHVSNAIK